MNSNTVLIAACLAVWVVVSAGFVATPVQLFLGGVSLTTGGALIGIEGERRGWWR